LADQPPQVTVQPTAKPRLTTQASPSVDFRDGELSIGQRQAATDSKLRESTVDDY